MGCAGRTNEQMNEKAPRSPFELSFLSACGSAIKHPQSAHIPDLNLSTFIKGPACLRQAILCLPPCQTPCDNTVCGRCGIRDVTHKDCVLGASPTSSSPFFIQPFQHRVFSEPRTPSLGLFGPFYYFRTHRGLPLSQSIGCVSPPGTSTVPQLILGQE